MYESKKKQEGIVISEEGMVGRPFDLNVPVRIAPLARIDYK